MHWLLQSPRRLVQWVSLIALNTNFLSLATERVCIPVMNCEACAFAWLACPIGMASKSIAFWEVPWVALGCVLVAGALVGRFLCGWVCPLGLLQDLLHRIPFPRIRIPRPLAAIKYGVLLVLVGVVAFWWGKESPYFFCNYCPTAALQVVIPSMIQYGDFSMDLGRIIRFSVLGVVLILALANHRSFCKVLCPVGAFVAVTNKFSWLRLWLSEKTCVRCTKCEKNCPMDVPVLRAGQKGRPISRATECISCLTCKQVCPVSAIDAGVRRGREGG